MITVAVFTRDDPSFQEATQYAHERVEHYFAPGELRHLFLPLDVLYYDESRRTAPDSTYGYRSGATLIARPRRSQNKPTPAIITPAP